MRSLLGLMLAVTLLAACGASRPAADPALLDGIARRYVILVLGLGRHDPNYVDAYYGPDSLKAIAAHDSLAVGQIRATAESLIAILGDSVPYGDSLLRLRHRYLRTQLGSLAARAGMLDGKQLTFDLEAKALYDVMPPHLSDAHFDSLLARLDLLLPGRAPLAQRYARFRDSTMIPAARVDTVFRRAIAACRVRTMAHISLPEDEHFDLAYVTRTPWGAYNWYKGGYHSLIQVNRDFPIPVDRAIDLACHEGYPGHHVYNAMLERALVRGRGWVGAVGVSPVQSPVADRGGERQLRHRHGVSRRGANRLRARLALPARRSESGHRRAECGGAGGDGAARLCQERGRTAIPRR
jgi:hypothetical protein